MAVNIQIKNIAQIRSAFAKSPAKMTKNLNLAIRRVGLRVSRDSRRFTPVDTGRLRASHKEHFANLKGEIRVGGFKDDYAAFVHEGTRFMKARPFLADAVESNESFTDKEFKHAVQSTLNELARDIG
jgi:HK97 gp10 family phage protein